MCLVWGCVMLRVLGFWLSMQLLIVSEGLCGPEKDLLISMGPEKDLLQFGPHEEVA